MFVGTGRPRKPIEREEARELRQQGVPIKRIAKALDVSPSSVFYWTRDIELTEEQQRRNLRGPRGPHDPEWVARRAAAWRRRSQKKRLRYQREGRERAREGDPLHMAGCLLYWAEGTKSRNTVCLVNSDVNMVRFFAEFLRGALGVKSDEMTIRLNVYTGNGLSVRDIENHWLQALELPRTVLRGHTLNHTPTSSSGAKTNRLPYGVCSLRVLKSTRLVQHIYGAIQEYAGFEEPRWLDGPPVKKARSAAPAEPSGRGGDSRPRRTRPSGRRTARPR
jgi:AcrR family transcriptional regulator